MEMEINCKFPLAHSGRQQIRTAHNPSTGPIKQTIRSLSIQKNAGVRRCVSSTAARICSSIFSVCSPTHGTFLFFFFENFQKKSPQPARWTFQGKNELIDQYNRHCRVLITFEKLPWPPSSDVTAAFTSVLCASVRAHQHNPNHNFLFSSAGIFPSKKNHQSIKSNYNRMINDRFTWSHVTVDYRKSSRWDF